MAMTFHHDPFRARASQVFDAQVIFSKQDKARVKVKIEKPGTSWMVNWGDGTHDKMPTGVDEVIHQYGETSQGTRYEILITKGGVARVERIGY